MIALGVIFIILSGLGFLFYLYLVAFICSFRVTSFFKQFFELIFTTEGFFIFITILTFLILGIIFIIVGKKRKNSKIALENRKNEEREMMKNQIDFLKQKELELKILKENNLIKDNKEKFCSYCGARLENGSTECSHCGGVINRN